MLSVRCKVEGLQELSKALEALPKDLAEKALRQATAAGAAIVRDEAKARAPRDTGKLISAAFVSKDKQQTDELRAVYHVGIRSGKRFRARGKKGADRDAFYWKFLEFGHFTRHASSQRRDSRLKRFAKRAVAKGVRFIAGRPFLRPALETKRAEVVERIKQVLAARIRRFTASLAKRGRRS